MPVALYNSHGLKTVKGNRHIFHLKDIDPKYDAYFQYTLVGFRPIKGEIIEPDISRGDEVSPDRAMYNNIIWDFLIRAVREAKEQGYLY